MKATSTVGAAAARAAENPAVKSRSPAFDAAAEAARLKADTRARRRRHSRS